MDGGVINIKDYKDYLENTPGNRLYNIWEGLVNNLSSPELQEEALRKGFTLVPHPSIREDGISKTFLIVPHSASEELKAEFENMHNVISLIKE